MKYRWQDCMFNDLVFREATGLRQVTCIVRELQLRFYGHVSRLPTEDLAHRILSCRDRGAGPAARMLRDCVRWRPICRYGHGGPSVCLGDGQTEADGVMSQGGRGDALLRRMPLHITCPGLSPVTDLHGVNFSLFCGRKETETTVDQAPQRHSAPSSAVGSFP